MKTKEKDECSYSFSNAIRTLVMASDCNLDIFAFTLFVTDFLYIPQLDNISSGVLWP